MSVFAMLGGLMFASKIIMEALPNIHLLGMLTMSYTLTFRKKALIPIYIYILLNGIYGGFSPWWVPYLYIWTLLWGMTMLLPKRMPPKLCYAVYPAVCALHGLIFGTLYAPAQAIMYGFSWEQTLAWIVTGFPYDVIHAVANMCFGMLIVPSVNVMNKLTKNFYS